MKITVVGAALVIGAVILAVVVIRAPGRSAAIHA